MLVGVYERETDVRAVFDGRFLAMLIQKNPYPIERSGECHNKMKKINTPVFLFVLKIRCVDANVKTENNGGMCAPLWMDVK